MIKGTRTTDTDYLKLVSDAATLFAQREGTVPHDVVETLSFLIEDAFIERHTKIEASAGQLTVSDMKSTNGTYVNGRKIAEPTTVRGGDKIFVGDFLIVLDPGGGASERTSSGAKRMPGPPPPPPPPPPPRGGRRHTSGPRHRYHPVSAAGDARPHRVGRRTDATSVSPFRPPGCATPCAAPG